MMAPRSTSLGLRILSLLALFVVVAGCSSEGATEPEGDAGTSDAAATSTTTTSTTTTIPDRPPELRIPSSARAEIGQTWTDAIVASDPDGDLATVEIEDAPRGFFPLTNSRGLITGFEWTPTEAGQWPMTVVATDATGLVHREELLLIGRYPRSGDHVVAMGGSVAAGFGRDRSDYFASDECWRGESIAYPTEVVDQLVAAGALGDSTQLSIVACSGHDGPALLASPVIATDGSGDVIEGDPKSQLDWAVTTNPTIVTLMAGAADARLLDPTPLFIAGAGNDPTSALDRALLDARLDDFDRALDDVLGTLVTSTDAHIALATWYDPTAIDPVGVDGCDRGCFRAVSGQIIDELNARIRSVARRHPAARLTLVQLDDLAVGREAPNGLGPDILRENGLGPLQGIADRFTGGGSPWCANDDGPETTVISRLDCVHPNEDGQQAIAERVAQALLDL
jgi:lysophospholipase L1-like esterase